MRKFWFAHSPRRSSSSRAASARSTRCSIRRRRRASCRRRCWWCVRQGLLGRSPGPAAAVGVGRHQRARSEAAVLSRHAGDRVRGAQGSPHAAPHGAGDDAGDEGAWYRQNARLSRVSRGGSARPGGGTPPRRATIPPARARRRFRQSCAAAGPSRRGCRSAPCRAFTRREDCATRSAPATRRGTPESAPPRCAAARTRVDR